MILKNDENNIVFGDTVTCDTLQQFEMTEEMIEELVNKNNFILRGKENDNAVLCTDKETYAIQSVQSTNTNLLALPLNKNNLQSIKDAITCYYELVKIHPYSLLLRDLLRKSPYLLVHDSLVLKSIKKDDNKFAQKSLNINDQDEDDEITASENIPNIVGYTFEDLKNIIQASNKQIFNTLCSLPLLQINNLYVIVDKEIIDIVTDGILTIIGLQNLDISYLSTSNIINELVYIDRICSPTIASVVLYYHLDTKNIQNQSIYKNFSYTDDTIITQCNSKLPDYIALSPASLVRIKAKKILQNNDTMVSGKLFHRLQRNAIPIQVPVDVTQLKGLVVVVKHDSKEDICVLLDASELPFEIRPRLNQIFSVKRAWTAQEIEPYIHEFLGENDTLEQFLLKHTRILKIHVQDSVQILYAQK